MLIPHGQGVCAACSEGAPRQNLFKEARASHQHPARDTPTISSQQQTHIEVRTLIQIVWGAFIHLAGAIDVRRSRDYATVESSCCSGRQWAATKPGKVNMIRGRANGSSKPIHNASADRPDSCTEQQLVQTGQSRVGDVSPGRARKHERAQSFQYSACRLRPLGIIASAITFHKFAAAQHLLAQKADVQGTIGCVAGSSEYVANQRCWRCTSY